MFAMGVVSGDWLPDREEPVMEDDVDADIDKMHADMRRQLEQLNDPANARKVVWLRPVRRSSITVFLIALCVDGSMWRLTLGGDEKEGWHRLPGIPIDETAAPQD
jgi:hypothetical protein